MDPHCTLCKAEVEDTTPGLVFESNMGDIYFVCFRCFEDYILMARMNRFGAFMSNEIGAA